MGGEWYMWGESGDLAGEVGGIPWEVRVCLLAESPFRGEGDRGFWLLYTLPADQDMKREARCHQTTNPRTMRRQGKRILPTGSSQSKCPLLLQQYSFIQPPTYLSSMPFHVSKSQTVTSSRLKSEQRAIEMRNILQRRPANVTEPV